MTNYSYVSATIGSDQYRFTFNDIARALVGSDFYQDGMVQNVRDDGREGAYLVIIKEARQPGHGWELRINPGELHVPAHGMNGEYWATQTPGTPFWSDGAYRRIKATLRPLGGRFQFDWYRDACATLDQLTEILSTHLG